MPSLMSSAMAVPSVFWYERAPLVAREQPHAGAVDRRRLRVGEERRDRVVRRAVAGVRRDHARPSVSVPASNVTM